jgi:hypothetical protein
MLKIIQKAYFRGGRRSALILAGSAAMAAVMIGGGTAIAATSQGRDSGPGKNVASPSNNADGVVSGTTVVLGPNQYGSAAVTCPPNTEIFGGGESNSATGALVLTDSWPTSNTSWLVYVKNNSSSTYTFTPYAVCR